MLSEQRVMHMTKMAMIEDKQGRKLGPAIHYRKRDYLSLCTLGGVFLGTLIYAALYAGLIVLLASTLVVNIHLVGLILGILLDWFSIYYICTIIFVWCADTQPSV